MLRGMAIIDYSWQKKKKKKNKFYSDSDWSALHFLCFSRFIHLIRLYSLCFHCTPRTTILIGQECTLAVVRTLHYCTVLRGRILLFLFSISHFYSYSVSCSSVFSCHCCCWLHFCRSGRCHCPCYCYGLFAHTSFCLLVFTCYGFGFHRLSPLIRVVHT